MAMWGKPLVVYEEYYHALLQVGDARITAASDEAALLHGYESGSQLVGKFASQFSGSDRDYYRKRWYLRCREKKILKPYPSPLYRPDGSFVYVMREHCRTLHGSPGNYTYITEFNEVCQVDNEAPNISFCSLNIDQNDFQRSMGKLTVQQFHDLILSRKNVEKQRNVYAICTDIGTIIDNLGGVDKLFSSEVAISYRNGKIQAKFLQTCDACGHTWFSASQKRGQCTAKGCRLTPPMEIIVERRESALAGIMDVLQSVQVD